MASGCKGTCTHENRKQNVSCSWSHRLILWVPPQAERGGCMQGNGLEKESWAHLPFHSSSRPLLSLLADANNRDASEAPMQVKQRAPRPLGARWLHSPFNTIAGRV
jgi:hypothetical protein